MTKINGHEYSDTMTVQELVDELKTKQDFGQAAEGFKTNIQPSAPQPPTAEELLKEVCSNTPHYAHDYYKKTKTMEDITYYDHIQRKTDIQKLKGGKL